MTFHPNNFVRTATETWKLKEEYDRFIAENAHLAAPFHIRGLEDILPKQYPGNLTVHFAKSHHGKSTALRNSAFKAQSRVEDTDFLVGIVSLEDSAETNAAKWVQRYEGNNLRYQDDQMVFIGNSFNMSAEDMGKLNIGNIIRSLEYALEQLPGKKGYSHIYLDYAQLVPPDPERSKMMNNDQKRLQIADDVRRLFHAAKQFKCPVDFASQALLKQQRDNYTSTMRIPGASDLKEAGELYEIPDIAISYWMPKLEPSTPVGTHIEDGAWSFHVEKNLIFIRIAKWRNAELMGFLDTVGRVFPCWIENDGEIVYYEEKHKHMMMKAMPEA
jgi:hypothetical protein